MNAITLQDGQIEENGFEPQVERQKRFRATGKPKTRRC